MVRFYMIDNQSVRWLYSEMWCIGRSVYFELFSVW